MNQNIQLFERLSSRMNGWIRSVSRRCATALYGAEDIEQEALIKLWHCIGKHPEIPDEQMIGLFKFSFCRRLADLMTQARQKRKPSYSLNVEIDLTSEWRSEHNELWYEEKIREFIELCESEELKSWVRKAMTPGSSLKGMRREVYDGIKEVAARCST
jgi:DNA-directed RNA polymerase specialized sigma24 family protein